MEKRNSIKKRLLQVAKYKGISYEKFFKEFGTTYANFKGKSLNSSLRSNVLVDFHTKYPDIDLHWLLTNEGEMLLSEATETENKPQKEDTMKKNTKNYKELYYEQLNKNMLLHEKLLTCIEGNSFSKEQLT